MMRATISSTTPGLSRLIGYLVVVLAAAALASCSNDQAVSDEPVPTPSSIAPIRTASQIQAPLKSYMYSEQEERILNEATTRAMNSCMRRFGQRPLFTVADPNGMVSRLFDRRYGLVDAADAERFGYNPPPSPEQPRGSDNEPTPTQVEQEVMSGHRADGSRAQHKDSQGQPLDEYGCGAEGTKAIQGDYVWDSQLIVDTDTFAQTRFQADPLTSAVTRQWAQCMSSYGYSFKHRSEAGNSLQDASPDEQRQMAVRDTKCAQKVNYIGTLNYVDSQYQQRYIEQRRADFDTLAEHKTQALKRAREALRQR